MKRLGMVVFLALVASSTFAADFGTARSLGELIAVRDATLFKRSDYNSQGGQWKAAVAFCVCEADRGLIIWGRDLLFYRESSGVLVNQVREQASRRCGGCRTAPALEWIDLD